MRPTTRPSYQLLIMSCTGIAFGLVNQAKTKTLIDDDAYMAWKNLETRYAPHSVSDLIQLASDFNKCKLNDDSSSGPDEWFIEIDLIQSKMMAIDPSFEKKEICERYRQASSGVQRGSCYSRRGHDNNQPQRIERQDPSILQTKAKEHEEHTGDRPIHAEIQRYLQELRQPNTSGTNANGTNEKIR